MQEDTLSLYLKQIEQLVALQKVDDEIFVIRQEMEKAPREVEELRAKFADLQEQKNRLNDKMSHLKEQAKRLDFDIDTDMGKIKKSKNKLMQVGNAKEYHAMMREMDSLEKSNRSREEEKITLAEELERHTAAITETDERYAAMQTELQEKEATLDSRLSQAEKTLKGLDARRGDTGKEIPLPVLSRYEFIRQRLPHPVIVSVKNGVCSGCNIAIPPQSYIELQKGAQILSCPNCQRLIYWSEHFSD